MSSGPLPIAPADARDTSVALTASPLPAAELRSTDIPTAPGLYAWWAAPDAIAGLAHGPDGPLHPDGLPELDLLCVGISNDLRRRLVGKHLGSSTGGSTLRRTLAALLPPELELITRLSPNGDRVTLEKDSESRLTDWMRSSLFVTWVTHPAPTSVERDVIHLMAPPCNVEHNGEHPNYPAMVTARADWRQSVTSVEASPVR